MWINYEDANIHAQQDIHDIINKIYFYIQAEDWEKPIWFDSNWNLNFENIEPKLTKEEFNKEILKLIWQEYKNVAKIIYDNRENLYTLWIELYWKEFLNDEEINLILKIQ